MVFSFFKDFCAKIVLAGVIVMSPVTTSFGMHTVEETECQESMTASSTDTPRWFNVYCAVIGFFTKPIGRALQATADTVEEGVVSVLKSKPVAAALESGFGLEDFPTMPAKNQDSDECSCKDLQPTVSLKPPKTLIQGLCYGLLFVSVVGSLVQPVGGVESHQVNPKEYDVCLSQENDMTLCFKLNRENFGCYTEKYVDSKGNSKTREICANAPVIGSMEACLFKPNNPSGAFLCKTLHLTGNAPGQFKQMSSGRFEKLSDSYVKSWSAQVSDCLDSFGTPSIAPAIVVLFGEESGTCRVSLTGLSADGSALRNAIQDISGKLNINFPSQIDFSSNAPLCSLIKERSEKFSSMPDYSMKALIAQVLSQEKIKLYREKIIDQISHDYQEPGSCSLFGLFCASPTKIVLSTSSPAEHFQKYGLSDDVIEKLGRFNSAAIVDLFAGLATSPHDLARGYALLVNAQNGRAEEQLLIPASLQKFDWKSALAAQKDKPLLDVGPVDERYRVAPLLELGRIICLLNRWIQEIPREGSSRGFVSLGSLDFSRWSDC